MAKKNEIWVREADRQCLNLSPPEGFRGGPDLEPPPRGLGGFSSLLDAPNHPRPVLNLVMGLTQGSGHPTGGHQSPREEAGESPTGHLWFSVREAIPVSIVDVHTAKAGTISCLKTLQGGPDGHICELILVDIPYSCHGKAKAGMGESIKSTQRAYEGEGTILQNKPVTQLSREA